MTRAYKDMDSMECNTALIRELNDQFRTTLKGGQVVLTHGISSLEESERISILVAVMKFDKFTEANDPHEEHDFGAMEVAGHTIFWQIVYFDLDLRFQSPEPSDPEVTKRVLTIMLAAEY